MKALIEEIKAISDGVAHELRYRSFNDPSNKWITRSALQKAIRRNELEVALKCTEYMLGTDEEYYWHSMSIIAIEDIGPTDPKLITYCTAMGTSSVVRKQVGDSRALAYTLVKAACEGTKTRACCEVSLAAEVGYRELGKSIYAMSEAELIKTLDPASIIFGNMKEDVYAMYYALGIIRGKIGGYDGLFAKRTKSEASVEEVMKLFDKVMSVEHAEAAKISYEKVRDTMFLAYHPVLAALSASDLEEVDDVMPEVITLKTLPSYAFDMHTQKGKTALKAFYTNLKKRYPLVASISPDNGGGALGAAVFVEEGGLERRRITSPLLKDLKDAQDETFIISKGVRKEDVAELREIVRKEIPVLNQKRKWAVEQLQ